MNFRCYLGNMFRLLCVFVLFAIFEVQAVSSEQAVEDGDHDSLVMHINQMQKNISDLWTFVRNYKQDTMVLLGHMRQHQMTIESTLNHMMHHSDHHSSGHGTHHSDDLVHGESHHDSHHSSHDEGHHGTSDSSHSNEQHSDEHHHDHDEHHDDHHDDHHSTDHQSEDHQHSSQNNDHHDEHHQDEHHHHEDDNHQHSSKEHHDDHHSDHSGEHHDDHSDEHHSSSSSSEHHHNHDDSNEQKSKDKHDHSSEDHSNEKLEQSQNKEVVEPLIVPKIQKSRDHHHSHHSHSHGSDSDVLSQFNQHISAHEHHNHSNHHMSAHRHHNQPSLIPSPSNRNLFLFAECDVRPNDALPATSRQEVTGKITLWQKKIGGPLGIHIRVRGFNVGGHTDHQQQQVDMDHTDHTEMPTQHGHKHGFHVHSIGDLSNGCQSTGSHFNPEGKHHGGPHSAVRHIGDFGNIECDEHGITDVVFYDEVAELRSGSKSILGRALVIHEHEDDLGSKSDDPESLTTGNAGARLACCIIQSVDQISFKTYRSIKFSSQRNQHG